MSVAVKRHHGYLGSWPKRDDPRHRPEVVSESALHTSTLLVIVPPGGNARSDHRGLG